MSLDTSAETDVAPCRSCRSPVFDDEVFCEVCGARTVGESSPEHVAPARHPRSARSTISG